MKLIGPLMWEHRLIERMVDLLDVELNRISRTNKARPDFITAAVDFFRTYADRTHHGKEEDILFRDLSNKKLALEHKTTMDELVAEHVFARKMVGNLVAAKENYVRGEEKSLKAIVSYIRELVKFYPAHIEKEDKHFFYPILEYLNAKEQDDMLKEFYEFDSTLIHEKYTKLLEEWKGDRI